MKAFCMCNADAADPSVLVHDGCCYMVNSSFAYLPGLLLWKSDDLRNWRPVAYAVTDTVREVWAPDLARYGEKFYIYFTADGKNWVVWADDIEGPYSQPVDLGVDEHIDPGHAVDVKTGDRYLFFNDGYFAQLESDGLSLREEPTKVLEAWPFSNEWETEGVCFEGPKVFYKNGYYYLIAAQGGTAGPATGHMAVSMRSKELRQGWEYSPYNPILHAESPDERWWSVGHATVFDWVDGKSYIIYHGYEKGRQNEGRKALLATVRWTEDGWFLADDAPELWKTTLDAGFNDRFDGKTLDLRWSFSSRAYSPYTYRLTPQGLRLTACGDSIDTSRRMALNRGGDYIFRAVFTHIDETCSVGLTLYYNAQCHLGLYIDRQMIFQFQNSKRIPVAQLNRAVRMLTLLVRKRRQVVSMWYAVDGGDLNKCCASFQVEGYQHNNFGGFTSLRPSVFLQGKGAATIEQVCFQPLESSHL